jgi:hypothetical protein
MSISTDYRQFKEAKEITKTIVLENGIKLVYSIDYRGRTIVSHFDRGGRFKGTQVLEMK